MTRAALDPIVHQATRLRILAALSRNRELSFPRLREALDLTEGNLGSHLEKLVEAGYVESRDALAGLSFETRWRLTSAGTTALRAYVAEITAMLAGTDPGLARGPERSGDPAGS